MTAEQLQSIREGMKMSRREFAEFLGDCTESAVYQWEISRRKIPGWVEERALRKIPIHMPIEDLWALFRYAQEKQSDPAKLLSQAIHDLIWKQKP